MKKTYKTVLICIVIIILAILCSRVIAGSNITQIFSSKLKAYPNGVIIQKLETPEQEIVDGYSLDSSGLTKMQSEIKNITIFSNTSDEKSFELVIFKKDGKTVSILPKISGSIHNFKVGKEKLLFTDNSLKGLWIADINNIEPVNIQPDTVNGISYTELMKKQDELTKSGKARDYFFLIWVDLPMMSPNEQKIIFLSNRTAIPESSISSLWLTDMEGNTELIHDGIKEGQVRTIGWLNDSEIIYSKTESHDVEKLNLDTKNKELLLEHVGVSSISPNGTFLIYQTFSSENIYNLLPEQYLFNITEKTTIKLDIPSGYYQTGGYGWKKDDKQLAFFIRNDKKEVKLIRVECSSGKIEIISPPDGVSFDVNDVGTVPNWSGDNLVISAGGRTFTLNS